MLDAVMITLLSSRCRFTPKASRLRQFRQASRFSPTSRMPQRLAEDADRRRRDSAPSSAALPLRCHVAGFTPPPPPLKSATALFASPVSHFRRRSCAVLNALARRSCRVSLRRQVRVDAATDQARLMAIAACVLIRPFSFAFSLPDSQLAFRLSFSFQASFAAELRLRRRRRRRAEMADDSAAPSSTFYEIFFLGQYYYGSHQ